MSDRHGNAHGAGRGVLPRGRPQSVPSVPDSPRYSMDDLVELTGLSTRTIRFYISQGMLTPAHGRGPSATYDKDHLLRLRLIEQLKEQHLPLRQIKEKLLQISTDDLEAHFAISAGPTEALWRRIQLRPDIELQVCERAERDYRFEAAVQQIVQYARFVLDQLEEPR